MLPGVVPSLRRNIPFEPFVLSLVRSLVAMSNSGEKVEDSSLRMTLHLSRNASYQYIISYDSFFFVSRRSVALCGTRRLLRDSERGASVSPGR